MEYANTRRIRVIGTCPHARERTAAERERKRERERASERAWAAFGLSQTLLGDNAGGGADHSAAEDTVLRVASGSRHASDPVLLFCGVFARARNAHAHLAVRGSCALCDARSEQGLNVPRGGPWRVTCPCITSMPRLAAFSSRLVLLAALAVCARRQRCRALLVCCKLLPCLLLPERAAPAYCRWPHFARSPAGTGPDEGPVRAGRADVRRHGARAMPFLQEVCDTSARWGRRRASTPPLSPPPPLSPFPCRHGSPAALRQSILPCAALRAALWRTMIMGTAITRAATSANRPSRRSRCHCGSSSIHSNAMAADRVAPGGSSGA